MGRAAIAASARSTMTMSSSRKDQSDASKPAFNLSKLKAKLVGLRAARQQHASVATTTVTDDLGGLGAQAQAQKMQIKSSDHKREVDQKHSANRKRTKQDTPPQVKFLLSKFKQVFQPFSKNKEKYSHRNGTKTTAHKHVSKQQE